MEPTSILGWRGLSFPSRRIKRKTEALTFCFFAACYFVKGRFKIILASTGY